jgi:hypothetical protein
VSPRLPRFTVPRPTLLGRIFVAKFWINESQIIRKGVGTRGCDVLRWPTGDRGRDTSLPGTPRTDPDGRTLEAHPVLIPDE